MRFLSGGSRVQDERQNRRGAAFLNEACTGDEALRQKVESLIAAQAQDFTEAPALEVVAKTLATDYLWSPVGQQIDHYKVLSPAEPLPLARYSREVPAELERIVTKTLQKDREERYQSVKDLPLDLKNLNLELEARSTALSPGRPGSAVILAC